MNTSNIYQFTVNKINGEEIPLSQYSNKVLLIVNTASQCGFTPQLQDLAELKTIFADTDFEVLAFPSNDFGQQEPLDGAAIEAFCHNYGTNFNIFEKMRVRGPHAHPLYKFLADKKANGKVNAKPRWNFHKYLIDKEGCVVDFFYPFTKPTSSKIKKKIQRLLAAGADKVTNK
ncbi:MULTISPECIES: glutathione peroxidase [unclassified Mucilaginibacter]|uniref:glutathione peroxidase n=1 Tax=unclassified Mucilaginibacter TaxID=2617802 RepID=UPI00096437C1|nr:MULTISPECIES: glutathione peroxidase [unclassified Mucilaginibacter]OJW13467.1 MAG: glutathione peroxidase [Mucilaginibacter sp. 44-25]PLW89232.1 MAG: glutathione peroxidase [Mucilaginibacter sp.]HEK20540.1 glutathione peroxidase [Bacteroidota bacterium]